ncbi:MAG: transcription termination factor NusA [Rhodobacteraceae bacterium]|nr:transcription termination factor NusA [Paracoccaceae bacterium]
MSFAGANRLELLQIAESVAQEKLIDRELVIKAIESSLCVAARNKYGELRDIRVSVDPTTGEQTVRQVRTVVEEVENDVAELSLEEAREIKPDAEIGDEFVEELESFDMGRIVSQRAKQALLQQVRGAERERQYEEFKDRVGTLIVGTVKREEYGNIIVDLTRGEGIIRREDKIGRESYGVGERLRSYVRDVRSETRGPQIFLSRTAKEFMIELFRNEVPEIYEGTIVIRAVARDPGSRAKIAVESYDSSIDPVGACVGMRGSRVQTVVNELQGERIDVIPWTENLVDFIVSALQPATVTKVMLTDAGIPREVVVPDDQLSLAIGRRGQNVNLARELTGLRISIVSESEERERRNAEAAEQAQKLMDAMDIDEVFAQYLVSAGFDSIELLAACDQEELASLEGLDSELAEEIQERAGEAVRAADEAIRGRARELGLQDDLAEFEGLSSKMLLALAENEIFTLGEFAITDVQELSGDHGVKYGRPVWEPGILSAFDVTPEEAFTLILQARVAAGILTFEEAQEQIEKQNALLEAEAAENAEDVPAFE